MPARQRVERRLSNVLAHRDRHQRDRQRHPDPEPPRHVAQLGVGAFPAAGVIGSSAMPQIGQLPGPLRTICGCIGQVHWTLPGPTAWPEGLGLR